MKIRRVVVATGPDGKSRLVEDRSAPRSFEMNSAPGTAATLVWATRAGVSLSHGHDGVDSTESSNFVPAPGESRLMIVTYPPDVSLMRSDFDPVAFGGELARLMPGLAETFEPDCPGMHTTDSIDYDVVLDGEIVLELDDGKEVLLRKHDVAIQHGTRHAWRNRSDKSATVLYVMLGAGRAA